jgi:predicted Zn finger-like uncharacterized protein
MSLATRCPACQTVFRVVQDQLRVSEGWVRCGRCAEVFNALEHMVEVARPAPPAVAPPGAPDLSDAAPVAAPTAETGTRAAADAGPDSAQALPAADDPIADLPPGVVAAHEEQAVFVAVEPQASAAQLDTAALLDLRPGADDHEPAGLAAAVGEAGPSTMPEPEPEPEPESLSPPPAQLQETGADWVGGQAAEPVPSFLRQAQRAERWGRPGVRAGLFAVLLLGLGGLALQVSLTYRDLIAARWAASRAWLEPLCLAAGCRIEQPRWLDAVVVDSTGLTRNEGTSTYRLQVVLRNRSAMALALPWIDLSLTDSQGRLVARRAISARELGSAAPGLAAQGELALQATLGIQDRNGAAAAAGPGIAGYTIEIFYP